MNILIVTDAWFPQVNGVVRTLENITYELREMGHSVNHLTPQQFKTFPAPSYPEIRLAWNVWTVGKQIRERNPNAIHIATEGPIGIATKLFCDQNNIPYTTSYHTKMPDYIHIRYPIIPKSLVYTFLRWLHGKSKNILVTTETMKRELAEEHFNELKIVAWTRGVDKETFTPNRRNRKLFFPNKILMVYAGRVSDEKNLEAFLSLNFDFKHLKIIVGDGPARKHLQQKYPNTMFTGYKHGNELASWMANADVFVFPSLSDTYGIVMIEAASCGTPIAGFPVTGPKDVVEEGITGALDQNLSSAIIKAVAIDRTKCYQYTTALYSWRKCAEVFFNTLTPI